MGDRADRPTLIRQRLLLHALCASQRGRLLCELAKESPITDESIRRDLVEVLRGAFTRPLDFDRQQDLQHLLGVYQTNAPLTDVRIRFSAEVTEYVTEHRSYQSQQLEEQADGSRLVRLQLSDLTESCSWALSLSAGAEGLPPQELPGAVRDQLQAALDCYTDSETHPQHTNSIRRT